MAIRKYKPTTPGRRGASGPDFAEITRGEPEKALVRPLPRVVHVHFHDYELLEPVRRAAIAATLRLLALRRRPVSLGELGAEREVSWSDVCGV